MKEQIKNNPIFIVSCIRSGSTVLERMLLKAFPGAIRIAGSDFEGNLFWTGHDVCIGTPKTNSFCKAQAPSDLSRQMIDKIHAHFAIQGKDNKRIVSKNPHLANKIGLLQELFPDMRIVHLVRFAPSVIASTKLHFEKVHGGQNARGLPIIHYWPDKEKYPCWWLTASSEKKPLKHVSFKQRLKYWRQNHFILPRHAIIPYSEFLASYPDESRYYPGKGFKRVAESWVQINANIIHQVDEYSLQDRYLAVNYDEMVSETHKFIGRIADFVDIDCCDLNNVPAKLDESCKDKWKANLSERELAEVCGVIEDFSKEVGLLKSRLPGPLVPGD